MADGSKAWIADLIDDHARFAIGAHAVRRFTPHAAWAAMETAVLEHGAPRQLISDNGLQFRSRKSHKPVQGVLRRPRPGTKHRGPATSV